jgi:hypothetical protein
MAVRRLSIIVTAACQGTVSDLASRAAWSVGRAAHDETMLMRTHAMQAKGVPKKGNKTMAALAKVGRHDDE